MPGSLLVQMCRVCESGLASFRATGKCNHDKTEREINSV